MMTSRDLRPYRWDFDNRSGGPSGVVLHARAWE